ncbi:MAG: hypothetical protein H0W71_09475 [Sphingomonas sp.]|nr:hypothetical protein [Sphingomonas sp.]
MSAGSFIAACIRKTRVQLEAANIESAARQHEIPVEWARFYLRDELNRNDRRK